MALAASEGSETLAQMADRFDLHAHQIAHRARGAATMIAWLKRLRRTLKSDPQADLARGKDLLERRLTPAEIDLERVCAQQGLTLEEYRRWCAASPENSPEAIRPDSRKLK